MINRMCVGFVASTTRNMQVKEIFYNIKFGIYVYQNRTAKTKHTLEI